MWPFRKKKLEETRSAASGFTAEIMAARESYLSGRTGVADLTATAQGCISLWEGGLSVADVEGTNLLTPSALALAGRALALRGEAVFLIDGDRLVPCSDWDLKTRNSRPTAYRLSISEAGGGRTQTALAAEVLHFRIGADVSAPYYGQAPLKRAQLSAGLLNAVETAVAEVFENTPLGSQIVPFSEITDVEQEQLSRKFRGNRGRVVIRESVAVQAGGGPMPQTDWRPSELSPDLGRAMTVETLNAAQNAICGVFGVLPGMLAQASTGPMVREGQRHLAQWMLTPIAGLMAEEATEKLGAQITLDVMRPLQAFDAGGRARALSAIVQTLALAKEAGLDPAMAMKLVDWDRGDG